MKNVFVLFRSFRVKVALFMILLMLFAGTLSNFLVYRYALESQMEQLRSQMRILASTMALSIDADTLMKIPLDKQGADTAQYKSIEERLSKIRGVDPDIIYIYVMARTGEKGVLRFIIDLKSGPRYGKMPPAAPGDSYDAARFPEMLEAFNGPTADRTLVTDEWGISLSGYAPIRGKDQEAVAILGVDMSADDVYAMQKEMNIRALFILVVGIVLSLVLGMLIAGRVTKPVKELVEGTRHIAKGDLRYKVKVKGHDEMSELASAFNQMSSNLYAARKKLLEYFYRVVQSLIRILEARDPYTKGHSDRVSEYSEKIARRMNLPEDKIDVLREAALLHDIGKLGVREVILDKKVQLTDEEREIIKKHPVIGENILKPVSVNKEVLRIVREHHERYDGKGYPGKLDGSHVDLLSAIVSVADSYDAMTSHRGYQKNFSRQEAIDQLMANSGSQFNPKIVEAFVQVLKENPES